MRQLQRPPTPEAVRATLASMAALYGGAGDDIPASQAGRTHIGGGEEPLGSKFPWRSDA